MVPAQWKWPHIAKGTLTWVPPLNAWRQRRISTGGTNNSRYCYSVWLRHLVTLRNHGFAIKSARVGELGPGDSIGTGLAALLSGAGSYVGLDVSPHSDKIDLQAIFDELVQLYERRQGIPDDTEFPKINPRLVSYAFPNDLIDWAGFRGRIERIRAELKRGLAHSRMIRYQAPWTSLDDVASESLDLIFSQAVLEYAVPLREVYRAMSVWSTKGGYASHVIDFGAHGLSPFWNGHLAYSNLEWRLARGCREVFLNREPLSSHLVSIKKSGFEILLLEKDRRLDGLNQSQLSAPFRSMDIEDLQTRGVTLVLRKKHHV
jgi:hypothetical protein